MNEEKFNIFGLLGMIFGILGCLMGCGLSGLGSAISGVIGALIGFCPSAIFVIASIVLGIIGISTRTRGKAMSIIAIVLGVVTLIGCIVITLLWLGIQIGLFTVWGILGN